MASFTDDIEKDPLFPYQVEGAKWLTTKSHALLADEMGLGKSAQIIHACDLLNLNKILILCPASVRFNWEREFMRFSKRNLITQVITKISDCPLPVFQVVITSYDLASRMDFSGRYDLLVLDESHYLKTLTAKRTKAVLGKEGLIHKANRTWALSGTPAPNHAGELWPILFTFGQTKLSYDAWVTRYCNSYAFNNYTRQITGTKLKYISEVKTLLSKVMLRRKKDEVMRDLPPIHFTSFVVERCNVDIDVEPSFVHYIFPRDRQQELKDKLAFEEHMIKSVAATASGDIRRPNISFLGAIQALAQSVSTLRRYTGLQKIDEVAKIVEEELENNAYEKIVIFAIHQGVIEGLRVKLKKFKPVTLYGGTPPEKKQRHVDKFQTQKHCRVFIGNIQAAGTGITLTAAHNVLFVEQSWVPGENAQAAMRCHRIGQKHPVVVRFVGLKDSIDEKIARSLTRKTKELNEIFEKELLTLNEFVTNPESANQTGEDEIFS